MKEYDAKAIRTITHAVVDYCNDVREQYGERCSERCPFGIEKRGDYQCMFSRGCPMNWDANLIERKE